MLKVEVLIYPPGPQDSIVTNEDWEVRIPLQKMAHTPGGDDCILGWGVVPSWSCEFREFPCFLGLAHLRVGWHLATFTCSVYHRPGVFAVGVADFSFVPPNQLMVKIGGLGFKRNPNHRAPNHQFSPIIVDQTKIHAFFFFGEEPYRWFFHSFRWPSPAASIYAGMRARCVLLGMQTAWRWSHDMDVSNNSGTPEIIHFNRVFHYKPSILVYHYFWKHPYHPQLIWAARSGLVPAILCDLNLTYQWFTGWWFQIFFIFTPTWGRFPFWLIFLGWVETTNQFTSCRMWRMCRWKIVLFRFLRFSLTALVSVTFWTGMGWAIQEREIWFLLTKHWNISKKKQIVTHTHTHTRKKGHHLWSQRDFEWWLKNCVMCCFFTRSKSCSHVWFLRFPPCFSGNPMGSPVTPSPTAHVCRNWFRTLSTSTMSNWLLRRWGPNGLSLTQEFL